MSGPRRNPRAEAARAARVAKSYDTLGALCAYEAGELDEAATIELFQNLLNTGVVWQLQGSYGRTAAQLIEAGLITRAA